MAINLPAELEHSIDQLAARHGFAKEDFVRDAVEQRIAEYEQEPELTEAQIARMRESIAQLDRGEIIASEQIDAKFDRFFQKLEQRAEIEEHRRVARS